MTAPEPHAGTGAPDPGRSGPGPYDLGITGDPAAAWQDGRRQVPAEAGLWAAQNAPRIASTHMCASRRSR